MLFLPGRLPLFSGRAALEKAPAAGGVWTSVWTSSLASGTDHLNWNTSTFVHVIDLAQLSATGGTQIRLTLRGPLTQELDLSALYVGNGGGGDALDFGSAPTQLLVSASGSFVVPGSRAQVVTDAANFVKDGTNSLVIAFNTNGDSSHTATSGKALPSGVASWFKNPGSEAATQDKAAGGYTSWSFLESVEKVELFI